MTRHRILSFMAVAVVLTSAAFASPAFTRTNVPITPMSAAARGLGWWIVEMNMGATAYKIGGFAPDLLTFFPYAWCLNLTDATTGISHQSAVRIAHRTSRTTSWSCAMGMQRYMLATSREWSTDIIIDHDGLFKRRVRDAHLQLAIEQISIEPSLRLDAGAAPVYVEFGSSFALVTHVNGVGWNSVTIDGVDRGDGTQTFRTSSVGTPQVQIGLYLGIGGAMQLNSDLLVTASLRARTAFTGFVRESDTRVGLSIEPSVGVGYFFL